MSGHDFSRAASATETTWASALRDGDRKFDSKVWVFPQLVKPNQLFAEMYGLKPVPFTLSQVIKQALRRHSAGSCVSCEQFAEMRFASRVEERGWRVGILSLAESVASGQARYQKHLPAESTETQSGMLL